MNTRNHVRRYRNVILLIAIVMSISSHIMASILVAPTVVFLSDKARTQRMTIQNPTDGPVEVSIYFSFGIPESDSLGNISVELKDDNVTDPRSALGWIKAFPRKVVVPAQQSQIIRLVARPPENLPDGEYWARIVFSSQSAQTELPPPTEDGAITTKLNMIMRTAIQVKYRTGDLVANLELNQTGVTHEGNKVHVLLDMTNRGNVSYMGVLTCRLLDSDGEEILKNRSNIAIYRDLKRRIDFTLPEGSKLPYKVDVEISPDGRTDVPVTDMIKGNKIKTVAIVETQ